MTDREARDERTLDALLAEARAVATAPSDDLVARVLADAARAQPRAAPLPRPLVAPPAPSVSAGWLAGLRGALGGWPALGGVAASGVIGLTLGAVQPASLPGLAAILGDEAVSVTLGADEDLLAILEG